MQFDDDLLNKTFYAWNVQGLLSDVLDFLHFSEAAIESQWHRELQKLELRAKREELENDYITHLRENVNSRFGISLPQRLRYAVLCAVVTTVEWAAVSYRRTSVPPIPPKPGSGKLDDVVYIFTEFNNRGDLGFESRIRLLQNLVYVRNCITHNAGLFEGYKHQNELPEVLVALNGFSLLDNPWVGPGIQIDKGILDQHIEDLLDWLPRLVEECTKKGLIQH